MCGLAKFDCAKINYVGESFKCHQPSQLLLNIRKDKEGTRLMQT